MSETDKKQKLEFHPNAWARFERAVDVVAKSPPQHRTKAKKKAKRKRAMAYPTQNMAFTGNLSPWHRPPRPSLNNGKAQRAVRRAFIVRAVLSTTELAKWAFPRGQGTGHNKRRSVRRACQRYCEKVGRASTTGRPLLWRLRPKA